jgi:hypothetical protein
LLEISADIHPAGAEALLSLLWLTPRVRGIHVPCQHHISVAAAVQGTLYQCLMVSATEGIVDGKATARAPLSDSTINSHVKDAEYAVRGEIVGMASAIAAELESGIDPGKYQFQKVSWRLWSVQVTKRKWQQSFKSMHNAYACVLPHAMICHCV